MSVIIFLVVLFVLILVHEWGHFIVAKKTGMRVDEFGIGFPPKLFGIKKGETEYTFNLFPIGGFVKIFGENHEDVEEVGVSGVVVADSFTSKSKWAQAAVLVAGVTMNVLFAWLLFAAVYMIGVPTAVEEGEASASAELVVTEVVLDSPAAEAQIPIGAEIVGLYTSETTLESLTPSSFSAFVIDNGAEEMTLSYEVGDRVVDTILTPATGLLEDKGKPAVGVALSMIEIKREAPLDALISATTRTAQLLKAITIGITTLILDALTFNADLTSVAGPVGIVSMVGDAAEFGFTSLLVFTAVISLNLAVINMLPFPALDGGRLVFVAIESIVRRPINPVWMARVNIAGFVILITLMIAVTYNDILRLI